MSERIRIERFDAQNRHHRIGVLELHDEQTREIVQQINIAQPPIPGQKGRMISGELAQKVKRERQEFEEKVVRAMVGKMRGTAFGHVAVDYSDPDRPKVVGYIVSHERFIPPIEGSIPDIRRRFAEFKRKRKRTIERVMVSGEYTYVTPANRRSGLASRLVRAHEAEAAQRGYTHRATSAGMNNESARTFLERNGYQIIRVDGKAGLHIMAKRLKPEAAK